MTHHPWWCLVVPIVMVLLAPVCQGDLEQDREALLTLYNATGGSEWTDNDGWATNSSDMSSWYGLSINATGSYVSRVSLGKNNLQGDLPPEIGNLTAVEDMYLGINSLTGPIPPELGKLQNLEVLDLNTNFLTGSIPKELGDLAVLEELYLFGNDLDGEIPPQLGNLEQMENLLLHDNRLTGEIPTSLGNLTWMTALNLADNRLSGEIPEEIGQLVVRGSLSWVLWLQNNYFSGEVPDDIPYYTPTTLSTNSFILYADLTGNLLTNWPDQRDEGATAPPLTSSTAARSVGTSSGSYSGSEGDLDGSTTSDDGDDEGDDEDDGDEGDDDDDTDGSVGSSSGALPSPSPSMSPSSSGVDDVVVAATSSSSSSTTVIAAITGGVVGGVAILAGVLIFCCMRRRKPRKDISRGASAPSEHNVRPASSSAAAGKVFLPLSGALSDTYGDEEQASYSWTRGKTDMNGDGGGGSSSSPGPLLTTEAAARLRASASSFSTLKSINTDDDNADPLPTASATTIAKANNGLSSAESTAQQSASGTVAEGVGTTVLDIASAALAGAEALAQQSFFPGVREAASVVAGLVGLASDHKNNGKESEKRARWCRSIVHTLERAAEVLGKEAKAGKGDSQAVHVLLDDVQDSIADLLQIIESYKSKNALSKVFVSTLCKKRQEDAEVAINAAVQRLQLGLQVRVGQNLASVGEAVQEGLDFHRRASQESEMVTKKKRRQHRLDQLEIPASDVEVTNEVLGRGGFGTVYLADLHGLNAAAKVVVFEDEEEDDDDYDDSDIVSNGTEGVLDGSRGVLDSSASTGDGEAQSRSKPQTKAEAAAMGQGQTESTTLPTDSQQQGLSRASQQSREHQRQRRMFMRELEAMKRLRGPHTVTIYGAVTSLPDRLVLVMELLQGGDLRHRLKKAKEPLEEKVLRNIVRDVCCGMAFLHAKATVHGDLKSANVLFDVTGRAKIADFGTSLWTQHSTRLATYTTKPREMVGMSLPWAAPEVLNRRGSSFEGDVYSFGVVVWECLSREVPWKGVAGVDKLVLAVTAGERPPIPESAPHDIATLAKACWVHDPSARPTFKKVLADFTLDSTNDESDTSSISISITSSGSSSSSSICGGNNNDNTAPQSP
ncbi:unnamed protein product [Ectocarpus sp. 6 AP-2014]